MYKQIGDSKFLSCDDEHSLYDPRMGQAFYPMAVLKRCIVIEADLTLDEICTRVKPLIEVDPASVNPDEYYIDILKLEREELLEGTKYVIMGTKDAMDKLWGRQDLGVESEVIIIQALFDGVLGFKYVIPDVLDY